MVRHCRASWLARRDLVWINDVNRELIIALAARYSVPAIYFNRFFTEREPLCHHARNDVGGAPGGKADDGTGRVG
jgi:hypothetical protein